MKKIEIHLKKIKNDNKNNKRQIPNKNFTFTFAFTHYEHSLKLHWSCVKRFTHKALCVKLCEAVYAQSSVRKAVWSLTHKLCAWNNLWAKFCAWNSVKQFTHKVLCVKLYEAVSLCCSCRIEHFLNSRAVAVFTNRAVLYYTNFSKKLHRYIDSDTDKYKDNLSCFIFHL